MSKSIRFDIQAHTPIYSSGYTGAEHCEQGPKPPLAARINGTMAMLRYAQKRDDKGNSLGFVCYVTPSYTGGEDDAWVGGKLRTPQCFGSMRETWAQPLGLFWTVHGEEPEGLRLTLNSAGWLLAPNLVPA